MSFLFRLFLGLFGLFGILSPASSVTRFLLYYKENPMLTFTPHLPARRPALSTILWSVAWPFFLFSLVLVTLMALSWLLLLPRYTRIDVGGQLRSAEDIRQYRTDLTAQITAKEEERRQSVLAVHDQTYDALKDARRARTPLDELQKKLREHAASLAGKPDAIVFHAFDYDPGKKTLTVQGDIRNVDTRSMTVLAEFSTSLKDLSFVESNTTPAFSREEDKATGFHSPFTITITLK